MKTKKEISAGGIVFKRQGNNILWLICQHSQHKGWVFPKGLVGDHDEKESMQMAALREVKEEGGVGTEIVNQTPVKIQYTYQWKNSPHGGTTGQTMFVNKTVYYFLMEFVSGDPKDHDWEMTDAKFVSEETVKKTLTYSSDKKAFDAILQLFRALK